MNAIIGLLKWLNVVPVPLLDIQLPIVRARAIIEANRLGVFKLLAEHDAEGGLGAAEVADKLGLSSEGTALLLRALKSSGYLKHRNGKYLNGRWARKWIVHPDRGLSEMLKLQSVTYERLQSLGDNVVSGRPSLDFHSKFEKAGTEGQETYTRGMQQAARMFIPAVLKSADIPAEAKAMIDIGGAHGEYARQFVAHYPDLHATVFDLGGPINTAKKLAEEQGRTERLSFVAGNAFQDDLGENWDVILLANFIHLFSPEQTLVLFEKCLKALAPTGVLLIVDQFSGSEGGIKAQLFDVISLNFFNVGGRAYTLSEVHDLLAKARFTTVADRRFPPSVPGGLIQASR